MRVQVGLDAGDGLLTAVYGNYFGQVAEDEAEKGAFTPEKAA